jgi:cellulose synthase/poly-beta-1,6-N-acetylglucosamine synthase-like glycosyltransferase
MGPLALVFAIVFWLSVVAVFYAYVGYPLVLGILCRVLGRQPRPPVEDGELPALTLLIVAHNEEAVIDARIRNALATDYPPEKLEIVVASDGSTDATANIVRSYAGRGVRLLDYDRRGKAAALAAAFTEVGGAVVMLSDVNTLTEPDAARRLARWFRDPAVGVVCGQLILTDPRTGGNADGLYWRYENFLKRCEARLGALLGANGAIYAIRRDCFVPPPAGTIVDDFVVPLLARLRTGCDIVYDEDAVAREETAPDVRAEFRRRCRIGAGGFQSLGLVWKLLDPRQGWIAFAFLSHKVLRWVCPFFLMLMFVTSLLLFGQLVFAHALALQLGFYLVAAATVLAPSGTRLPKVVRVAALFAGMNLALLVGFARWLRGNHNGLWRPTPRLAPETAG